MPEMILPGTYIEVRSEGLISAGRVSTGNIGIVGTALKGPVHEAVSISSLAEAKEKFGESSSNVTLIQALELIYQNGGRTVSAVRTGGLGYYTFKTTNTAGDDIEVLTLIEKDDRRNQRISVKVEKKKSVELVLGDQEAYIVTSFNDLFTKVKKTSKLVTASQLVDAHKMKLPDSIKGELVNGSFELKLGNNVVMKLEAKLGVSGKISVKIDKISNAVEVTIDAKEKYVTKSFEDLSKQLEASQLVDVFDLNDEHKQSVPVTVASDKFSGHLEKLILSPYRGILEVRCHQGAV